MYQIDRFNKGLSVNSPSNSGNPKNNNVNSKKPMQPQSNMKNSKITQIEIELNNNTINNNKYDVQSFTEDKTSSSEDNTTSLGTFI